MKKIVIIAVAALAVSFASCKKEKTCTCTDPNGDKTVTSLDKVSSGDANAACPKTQEVKVGSQSGGVTTCVLS